MLLTIVAGRVESLEAGSPVGLNPFAVLQQIRRGIHQVYLPREAKATSVLIC